MNETLNGTIRWEDVAYIIWVDHDSSDYNTPETWKLVHHRLAGLHWVLHLGGFKDESDAVRDLMEVAWHHWRHCEEYGVVEEAA